MNSAKHVIEISSCAAIAGTVELIDSNAVEVHISNCQIINTGNVPLKLYTLYAPPNHRDGVVHHTRADAEADTEMQFQFIQRYVRWRTDVDSASRKNVL